MDASGDHTNQNRNATRGPHPAVCHPPHHCHKPQSLNSSVIKLRHLHAFVIITGVIIVVAAVTTVATAVAAVAVARSRRTAVVISGCTGSRGFSVFLSADVALRPARNEQRNATQPPKSNMLCRLAECPPRRTHSGVWVSQPQFHAPRLQSRRIPKAHAGGSTSRRTFKQTCSHKSS